MWLLAVELICRFGGASLGLNMTDGKDNGFLWAKPCPSIAAVFVAVVFLSPFVRRHCFWVSFPLFGGDISFFLMALSSL